MKADGGRSAMANCVWSELAGKIHSPSYVQVNSLQLSLTAAFVTFPEILSDDAHHRHGMRPSAAFIAEF